MVDAGKTVLSELQERGHLVRSNGAFGRDKRRGIAQMNDGLKIRKAEGFSNFVAYMRPHAIYSCSSLNTLKLFHAANLGGPFPGGWLIGASKKTMWSSPPNYRGRSECFNFDY